MRTLKIMTQIDECIFTEPYKNHKLGFRIVNENYLTVSTHTRKPSEYHIERLVESIVKLGFLIPLVVIPNSKKDNEFIIVDGQHRFFAGKRLEIQEFPVLIIPQILADLLMNFNTEKELNIREKSFISLSIYRFHVSDEPELIENNLDLVEAIGNAYYVTLGLAYEKQEELSGSAFEPVLKRCDTFLGKQLRLAYPQRQHQANQVVSAQEMVRDIAQYTRETGDWHPYIQTQIIGWANPYKNRKIIVEFDDLFPQFIENLKKVKENTREFLPEILGHREDTL